MSQSKNALVLAEKVTDLVSYLDSVAGAACRMCGARDVVEGKAIALVCLQENMTFLDYQRTYHTIAGKPTMRADAMLAMFRRDYGGEYAIVECSKDRAAIELWDKDGNHTEWEFTREQALNSRWPWRDQEKPKTEDNLKDNWSTDEDFENQLWSRLISKSLRRVQPELVAGCYTPEEIRDVVDGEVISNATENPMTVDEFKDQLKKKREIESKDPVCGDVIDADFTVEDDGVPETAPPVDETFANKESRCTQAQRDKITSLRSEFSGMTDSQWANVLSQYKVNAINSLTFDQAKEIIHRMEKRLGK